MADELDQTDKKKKKKLGIENKIDRMLHSNISKGKGIIDGYDCNF